MHVVDIITVDAEKIGKTMNVLFFFHPNVVEDLDTLLAVHCTCNDYPRLVLEGLTQFRLFFNKRV